MKKLILLNLFALFLNINASCVTPNNEPGECISIMYCPPLIKIVENKPVSDKNVEYLRNSKCGHEGRLPKVCCRTTTGIITKNGIAQDESWINGIESNLLPTKKECGISTKDITRKNRGRIIGGVPADLGEFPWMALLEYRKPDGTKRFHCGGVLISKRYVLTAAHCIKNLLRHWKLSSVRLGEHDTSTEEDCVTLKCSDPPQNIEIEEKIPHESFDPYDRKNIYHDIGLLRLSRDVHFTEFIRPICFPTTTSELQDDFFGKNLTVAGWGQTETERRSNIKMKIQVPVRTISECSSVYQTKNISIGNGHICAGGVEGKDSCSGDSGGPLMDSSEDNDKIWTVAGIVSFGPKPCAVENLPGVYTKVGQFAAWIVNNMKP